MTLADSPFLPAPRIAHEVSGSKDARFVVYGVPWSTYSALRDGLDDHSGLRLTYLEGTLEFMSPGSEHEDYKTLIARLLEAYAEERDVDLNGRGGMTFRKEANERGLEPDECYSVGPFGETPDIAIEVVVSSGLVDKLAVYEGLRVPEVWVWKEAKFTVYRLVERGYEERARSEVLPRLDLAHLAGFVVAGANQTKVVKAYRLSLRSGP
jgi:Uma2 family endonuclease